MFSASASRVSSNLHARLRGQFLSPPCARRRQIIAGGLAVLLIVGGSPRVGAVVVTDDFSDGNDTANPAWHHLDGAVGSPGQSWTVSNGQYRLLDPTTSTVGSQFPGLETVGFVGSYVDPSFTDVRATTDFVDFVPPGPESSYFGIAVRLNGNNAQPNLQTGIQLHGYTYHYEGPSAQGAGEMVLGILHGDGIKDISPGGSPQVTLDPSKDYRFSLEAVGNVLHGQVFELNASGQVVGLVTEALRDLDASPPSNDNYDYDPNTPEGPFVPYASGYSGVFGVGFFLGADADFTIDNFRTETVASLPGDFDNNSVVNGADLMQWRGDFGVDADSDADDDGDSDGSDLLIWQQNVGAGGALAAVPEPGTMLLSGAAIVLLVARRRGRMAS
jgi:hypothetical protein